jgi:hypothetical protein
MNDVQKDQQARFLPFHAINEFMRPDFRADVIRSVMLALPSLPEALRTQIDKITRRVVKVPGFRNSAKAPAALRVKPTAEAFEKNAGLVAAILSAWNEAHPELRGQVYELLTERGWEILPADADRTKLPGFLTRWPKGEDFETLTNAYAERFPGSETSSDDVSLMVVWLSGRLPYELVGDDEEDDKPAGPEEG